MLVPSRTNAHNEAYTPSCRILGTKEFPATAEGYAAALAWMRGHASN